MTSEIVVVSGTVGAGKTSVIGEMSEQMSQRGVVHLAVDLDALACLYPRPGDDPYGQRFALATLADMWRRAEAAGARRLLVARVVEQRSELADYEAVAPGASIRVLRVTAPAMAIEARLRQREVGSALRWHLARAPELDGILDRCDVPTETVTNDGLRPIAAVAEEALTLVGW